MLEIENITSKSFFEKWISLVENDKDVKRDITNRKTISIQMQNQIKKTFNFTEVKRFLLLEEKRQGKEFNVTYHSNQLKLISETYAEILYQVSSHGQFINSKNILNSHEILLRESPCTMYPCGEHYHG